MTIVFTSGELRARNGGSKLYNLWVKLLREQGYDACIATQDGSYEPWLVEHQPVIDYDQVAKLEDLKIATGWLITAGLDALRRGRPFYYYDADLKWTLQFRSHLDRYLDAGAIAAIATHCRYIQAWYIANYGIEPTLINEWCDEAVFYPEPERRVPGRVGCMREGADSLARAFPGLVIISGDERQVADAMRTVDVFVGLNAGKHPLWGEGCPRTQHEAMHCGCVLVAYDVLGNREYLYDGWTGVMVERGDVDALIAAVRRLLGDREEKERLRQNGLAIARGLFSDRGKIGPVKRWLQL